MSDYDVPRETRLALSHFCELVIDETKRQNIISAATIPDIWPRHIEDSLQLLPLAPARGAWLDIGSGGGFPGLVIAIASPGHAMTLVEPRALRSAFLKRLVLELGLSDRVTVSSCKVERVDTGPFEIVSARAVASVDRLFGMAERLVSDRSTWLLLKGRRAREELAEAERTWQGDFRLVPSRTDPDAAILVARGIKRRTKR